MSTNKTVQSMIEMKKGSESTLTKNLMNANNVAAQGTKNTPKKKKK